ncbi:hypothetical protein, partial [Pseudomonas sp. FSL R10-2964]|uniref:hypothetical protein n=1 Tax=Pseudomonas sp. FSL R10-2964 TaxID=2662202 RepID=UPI001C4999A0
MAWKKSHIGHYDNLPPMLHLLSPARSSVTQDLDNLWCSTCVEVKKNLRVDIRRIFGLKTLWWRGGYKSEGANSFWNVPCRSACSGLMKPDTHLGENARQIEVSDDQT